MGEPVFASEYDKYLAYLKSARWDELRTERIKMDNLGIFLFLSISCLVKKIYFHVLYRV